jgi:hypothetical protein
MQKSVIPFGLLIIGSTAFFAVSEYRIRREVDSLKAAARRADAQAGSASVPETPLSHAEEVRLFARALAQGPAPSAMEQPAAKPQREPPAAAPPLTQEQVQENVLAAYARESEDPAWTRDAERKLQALTGHGLPQGSRVLSTECRATMCLIQAQHTDASTAQSWLQTGFGEWPGAVFVAGELAERDSVKQTLIAIRENIVPPYAGM